MTSRTMNKWFTLGVASVLAFGLAMGNSYAWGKEKSSSPEIRISKIIGSAIRDQHGAKLGKIKEMLVDPQEPGRILFAVVKPVGALQFSDRYLAIPFAVLSRDGTESYYVLNMTREELMKAPSFDEDHWPSFADRKWDEVVYRFYGQAPYWTEMKAGQE